MAEPVAAAQATARRAELIRRIESLHPVGRHDAQVFIGGARLRFRRGIPEEAALRAVAELQALGANVEVEPNRPQEDAILALDEFDHAFARPKPPAVTISSTASSQIVAVVDAAKLMTIDGIGHESTRPMVQVADVNTEPMAVGTPPAPKDKDASRAARDARAVENTSPMAMPVDPALHPPMGDLTGEVTAPRALSATSARPPSLATGEVTLPRNLARPGSLAPPTTAAPPATAPPPPEASPTVPELPAALSPVARIRARLREQPPARIGIGAVLALALGWALSAPYAGRAERHVAELRAEADRERYRLAEDARARVAALDAEADSAASRAAAGTAGLWLTIGAAAFAGWWRIT